ncbi:MAG TPA: metallophosphoesterase family protein [Thermoanaerobaculia bacterium]|nr:metallophosphoesterase family protein [Thermoanaerobaculia bacterium]
MRSILHVSDVHFGPKHLPHVAEGVLALIAERRPDVVVISGDLTLRAKPEQFREARRFVDRIPVPTLVVPGNHDVPLWRVWERALAPFAAYRQHFAPELEPVYRDEELLIVGINSAFNWTRKDGRIPLNRLLEVRDLLAAEPASRFKVVVVHHHLIPPPNFGSQRVLGNAYEAIDLFSRAGVDLVLSGHLHQTFIGSSEEFYPRGRPPVVILHAGTTTSNRGRAAERTLNSCNWIEVDGAAIAVSTLLWQPALGRFAERSRTWVPRQDRGGGPAIIPTFPEANS